MGEGESLTMTTLEIDSSDSQSSRRFQLRQRRLISTLRSAPNTSRVFEVIQRKMHPPLTLHRHPMCAEIIEEFQKCHLDHPIAKFFGECTDLKIKLDRCFRQEKATKRKANFEQSKILKERLQAYRKETTQGSEEKNFV